MRRILDRKQRGESQVTGNQSHRGFTLIELLIGMTILTIGLLGVAAMFPMGYRVVHDAGKMTMAQTGTRQILEDVRSVPFQNRRWRYALAGEGSGFTYTTAEKAKWSSLSTSSASPNTSSVTNSVFGAKGVISVVDQTATLRRITITVTIPGRTKTVTIATLVSRM